jgi:hypothetical protein
MWFLILQGMRNKYVRTGIWVVIAIAAFFVGTKFLSKDNNGETNFNPFAKKELPDEQKIHAKMQAYKNYIDRLTAQKDSLKLVLKNLNATYPTGKNNLMDSTKKTLQEQIDSLDNIY